MDDASETEAVPGLSFVEIGVSDLDRAEEFYGGLLGLPRHPADPENAGSEPRGRAGQPVRGRDDGRRVRRLGRGTAYLELVELGPDAPPTSWEPDDLQCGIRHVGLKVADIDAWVERLRAAGVSLAVGPLDAFGGVRIGFFHDPDGAYLELVQGYVQHNRLFSADLARQEADGDRDWDGEPRFDHVAVTVPDLGRALEVYRDRLGFGAIGQLVRQGEERGFLITNLRAAPGTLELFSFDVPTHERAGPDPVEAADAGVGEGVEQLGLRAVGVRGLGAETSGPGGVRLLPG